MKKKHIILILASVCMMLTACAKVETKFDGSRTGNESQLIMDFKVMNTTDSQLLELEENDIVDVEIISNSGSIYAEVTDEDGGVIYDVTVGSDEHSSQITIPESGTYCVSVTGEKAQGCVSFIKAE